MKPINKALLYIENHLEEEITIEKLSKVSLISPFHFARVFKGLVGYSVIKYVRYRRLTEAAKCLFIKEKSVFDIAFDVGYNSNAAFTKAFVKRFQCTPSECENHFERLIDYFVEPIFISKNMNVRIETPRVGEELNMIIAGMQTQFVEGRDIEGFYNKIVPHIPNIKNVTERFCNVLWDRKKDEQDQFVLQLFAGLPISKAENLPEGWITKEISVGKCLIFECEGDNKAFQEWIYAVYEEWFPKSDFEPTSALQVQFVRPLDMTKNTFHREVWIPVKE